MPDYNVDQEYIDSLLLYIQDGNEAVHRTNILYRHITLSGNIVDDRNELLFGRTPGQTFFEEPEIPLSGYFQGYEMGESTASRATPGHTSIWPREERRAEDTEDVELSPFEEKVISAARKIARNDLDERLFGEPRSTDEHMDILDRFERSIVGFFQGKDEETAYKESGGMTIRNRVELLKVVRDSMHNRDYEKLYQNDRKKVTRGQKHLINKIRRIREKNEGYDDFPKLRRPILYTRDFI
jgi:hypothetical protein